MRFLISAGEASGELYGAGLIEALRRRVPGAQFFGVGGQRMRDAGFDTVIDAHEIAVVGLAEVVSHLPRIYGEFKRLVREAEARKPDAAILIDFPDFNLRLARKLHQLGIPVIYYVSPQIWAWRQGRVEQIRRYVKKVLVIFPFEAGFYARHNVSAEYVGHPLADEALPAIAREQFATENGLNPTKTWIALLPGSRRKEVALNLPRMLETAGILGYHYDFALPVASSLSADWVRSLTAASKVPINLTHDARSSLMHARAAIVASGTATVEAALIGTPFVMIYRLAASTWVLGRKLVKLDRFAMPNLIAGRDVVREFVQSGFQPQAVAAEVRRLIDDGPERQAILAGLAEVRSRLRPPGKETAAERAADAVLRIVEKSR